MVGLERAEKSIRSPLAIIAAVQRAISPRSMPLRNTAMARAAICSSATTPRVYASMTQSICAGSRVRPSRLARMTSTASKGSTAGAAEPVESVEVTGLLLGVQGVRSAGPKACGSTCSMLRGPSGVSTTSSGAACSDSS